MTATYSDNLRLGTPAPNDRGWGDVIAADLAALDALAPIASLHCHPAETPSSSLSVVISPGRWRKPDGTAAAFAGASIAPPASATRSIYLDESGTLQAAAAYPVSWHVPIATVVTTATTVDSITDDRVGHQAIGVGSGGQLGGLVVAPRESPSASLAVSVSAGRYLKPDGTAGSYAGTASQTLPASATTVLYLDSAGALQTAASYPAASVVRLATVVTTATAVDSIADDRVAIVYTSPPGSAAFLPLAGGTMSDGAAIACGTTTGLQIGAAASQKLGFHGASPIAQTPAYTLAYSTSVRGNLGYTAAIQSSSYAGLANGQSGSPYAGVSDLNSLRLAYENLRDFAEINVQMLVGVVKDLKAKGLLG